MKKFIATLVIFICVGSALSAADLNVGGGLLVNVDFISIHDTSGENVEDFDFPVLPFYGFYAFVDMDYIEFDLGLLFFMPAFEIGAYGKFPIKLGVITLSPMVGIEFSNALFILNSLFIRAGLGIDINLSKSIFIRTDALYGYALTNSIIFFPININRHSVKIRAAIGFKL